MPSYAGTYSGPGTAYDVVKAINKGVVLTPAVTDGWSPILYGDEVLWISKECTQEVKA